MRQKAQCIIALMTALAVPAGAAALGAWKVLNNARNSGFSKAEHLYHEAIMNPDTAADLLSRPSVGSHQRLKQTLQRHGVYAGLAAQRAATLH